MSEIINEIHDDEIDVRMEDEELEVKKKRKVLPIGCGVLEIPPLYCWYSLCKKKLICDYLQ